MRDRVVSLFWNGRTGRPRLPWRLVAVFVVLAVLSLAAGLVVQSLRTSLVAVFGLVVPAAQATAAAGNAVFAAVQVVVFVGAVYLTGRFVDRRRFRDFGLHVDRAWWTDLGFGLVLGAALMTGIFLVELAAGWIAVTGTFQITRASFPFWPWFGWAVVTFLGVGATEELLTRGYLIKNVAEGLTWFDRLGATGAVGLAVAVSALVFGVGHAANPNASLASTTGILIAAVVLYASGDDLRRWLGRVVRWRVHPKWYAAAIGVPAVVALGSAAAAQVLGSPIDFSSFAFDPITLAIGIVLGTAIGGGQEELGWRGFAQPELQARYGGLWAAVIIGVLWGGWHLPLFFDPTAVHSQWPPSSQLAYFVGIVAFSILLAWVYNGSGGSVLLAMVMHGAENAAGSLVPLDLERAVVEGVPDWAALAPLNVSHAVLTWALALVVVGTVGAGLLAGRARREAPG